MQGLCFTEQFGDVIQHKWDDLLRLASSEAPPSSKELVRALAQTASKSSLAKYAGQCGLHNGSIWGSGYVLEALTPIMQQVRPRVTYFDEIGRWDVGIVIPTMARRTHGWPKHQLMSSHGP